MMKAEQVAFSGILLLVGFVGVSKAGILIVPFWHKSQTINLQLLHCPIDIQVSAAGSAIPRSPSPKASTAWIQSPATTAVSGSARERGKT